jgi:geranylgeranyl pyrophosphate synthase
MLHAGSLIIDDIEDGSEWRRGEPTLHRQVGLPLALNTGNWMYFRALELLGDLSVDEASGNRILSISIATIRECHEGQALDLAAKIHDIDQRDVLAVAEGIGKRKTGTLTSLAARLGAMTAGACHDYEQALATFGCELGICLQMRNDLDELRMVANDGLRHDDMKNARVTWPWAWYAESCKNETFKELQLRAYVAINDANVARNVATAIDRQIGAYGDQEIESRLQIAYSELSEIVSGSKPLHDLQLLLRAVNASGRARVSNSRFQEPFNQIADRAAS